MNEPLLKTSFELRFLSGRNGRLSSRRNFFLFSFLRGITSLILEFLSRCIVQRIRRRTIGKICNFWPRTFSRYATNRFYQLLIMGIFCYVSVEMTRVYLFISA